jgi:molybdopterin-guanine dinucleotide biosynthesis protein A
MAKKHREDRVSLPGMLLIGSAGKNSGKTELACSIIRHFSSTADITGVKITPIRQTEGLCPRGGEGCGVCYSMEDRFVITEEGAVPEGKDTTRMLKSGAKRVFWLRAMVESLEEGFHELMRLIGPDSLTVAESNSICHFVRPGLFLMVREEGSRVFKASAREALPYVDRIVVSDGASFDLNLSHVGCHGNRWFFKHGSAAVLAGGRSTRMRRDKSMLPVRGSPMISHILNQLKPYFSETMISTNEAEKYTFLDAPVVEDEESERGPLMAIASVLAAARSDKVFITACDIPEINMSFVDRMFAEADRYDCVIPTTGDSAFEPLFAVYSKNALKAVREALVRGERSVASIFARIRTKYLPLDNGQWYRNLNTVEEYESYTRAMQPTITTSGGQGIDTV